MKHLHFDLVGGLSGDMFIGALLDAFPALADTLPAVIETAGFKELVTLHTTAANDGTLTGTHFQVLPAGDAEGHHHRHYSEIRSILQQAPVPDRTREAALGIFHLIAEVEARIHGKTVDEVAFHEVGAWDSIADILCAAHLINAMGDATWSTSALPLGGGQVRTAHGMLPVPAPATALLLKGFPFVDDGISGERITPTGAAILRYLNPTRLPPAGVTLAHTGFGFGTRKFPGISNVARLLVFDAVDSAPWQQDQVVRLAFEIDDQTPEDLGIALERLRGENGVRDLLTHWVTGKKGRHMLAVRLLCEPAEEPAIIARCFEETTTLGIRRELVTRALLPRDVTEVVVNGTSYRTKLTQRPDGETAKAESDDIQSANLKRHDREQLRRQIETTALDPGEDP